jgi:hypothetical protein
VPSGAHAAAPGFLRELGNQRPALELGGVGKEHLEGGTDVHLVADVLAAQGGDVLVIFADGAMPG